jgi:hypothetical protein
VITTLSKLRRRVENNVDAEAKATSKNRRRLNPATLPSTQDAIAVVAVQDDVLILRNHAVVAGVGFGSMNDALLADESIDARLAGYRDLLKAVQFDFQLLIGTRPQDLHAYRAKIQRQSERLSQVQVLVDRMELRLPDYLRDTKDFGEAAFEQHFGFHPRALIGTPGHAHQAATVLCDPRVMGPLSQATPAQQEAALRTPRDLCDSTARLLAHWQSILAERLAYAEMEVEALQAPVRTFHFVTAFNPRLIAPIKAGALSADELDKAKRELDHRCAQISAGLRQMRLPHWRATHAELLEDIRHLYHPSLAQLHHELRAERSVAMRLASVVR